MALSTELLGENSGIVYITDRLKIENKSDYKVKTENSQMPY